MGKGADSLLSYVPGFLFDHLFAKGSSKEVPPEVYPMPTVALFADVSGFTNLSEKMSLKGREGPEELSKHLNNYLAQMIKRISKNGGDICKFAGDAIIVLWPLEESMDVRCLRAAQAALEIHECLDQLVLGDGISLRCKIGIGAGHVDILHIGGVTDNYVSQRMEYVALGEALVQSFQGENHSSPALTIVSDIVMKHLGDTCVYSEVYEGAKKCTSIYCSSTGTSGCRFKKLEKVIIPIRSKAIQPNAQRISEINMNPALMSHIWNYVALAVAPFLDDENETWGNELRRVSTLFMNLGISMEYLNSAAGINKEACRKLQNVFYTVQKEIFEKEGTINKFLVDDKGTTLVGAFGLPPFAHENDATRAVLSSIALYAEVKSKFNLNLSIGITTGMVFAGVVGHRGHRREYSLLADGVNLAARLMQEANKKKVGIIIDLATKLSCGHGIQFSFPQEIKVKGKSIPVTVFQPLPPTEMLSQMNVKLSQQRFEARSEMMLSKRNLLSQLTTTDPGGLLRGSVSYLPKTGIKAVQLWDITHNPVIKTAPEKLTLIGGSEKSALGRGSKPNNHLKQNSFIIGSKAEKLGHSIQQRRSSLLAAVADADFELPAKVDIRSAAEEALAAPLSIDSTQDEANTDTAAIDTLFEIRSKAAKTKSGRFGFKKGSSTKETLLKGGSKEIKRIVAVHLHFPAIDAEITLPVLENNLTVEDVKLKGLMYLERKGYPGMDDPTMFEIFIDEDCALATSTPLERLWSISLESDAILQMIVKPVASVGVISSHHDSKVLMPSPHPLSAQDQVKVIKENYLKHDIGSCVLLKGGIGTGKSYILTKEFVDSKDTVAVDVVLARGNPFLKGSLDTPYHVWRIVLTFLIENDFNRGFSHASLSLMQAAEERVMAHVDYISSGTIEAKGKLKTKGHLRPKYDRSLKVDENPPGLSLRVLGRMKFLFQILLQDNIDLKMTKADYLKLLADNHDDIIELIIETLNAFAEEGHLIIVIDDLQHVDLGSWDVILAIAENCSNLLLAVALRPFGFYVGGMEEPEQYKKLLSFRDVQKIDLKPLNAVESEVIALDVFQCATMEIRLKGLIMEKAVGNPLFIKEYCEALKEQSLVEVDTLNDLKVLEAHFNLKSPLINKAGPKKHNLKDNLDGLLKKNNFRLRASTVENPDDLKLFEMVVENVVPGTVQCIIASCVDRLKVSQRVILKIAAVIGELFLATEVEYVAVSVGMIEDLIRSDIGELIKKSIIKHVPVDGKNGVTKNDTYAFTQPFMREALKQSLLGYQTTMINKSLATYNELLETKRIREYEKVVKKTETVIFKEGLIKIRKFHGFFTLWKVRKVTLLKDRLEVRKEAGTNVVGEVHLTGAKVYLASGKDAADHKTKQGIIFCLESPNWSKKGVHSNFFRTFFYAAEDEASAADWVNRIHMRIVNLRASARRSSSGGERIRAHTAGNLITQQSNGDDIDSRNPASAVPTIVKRTFSAIPTEGTGSSAPTEPSKSVPPKVPPKNGRKTSMLTEKSTDIAGRQASSRDLLTNRIENESKKMVEEGGKVLNPSSRLDFIRTASGTRRRLSSLEKIDEVDVVTNGRRTSSKKDISVGIDGKRGSRTGSSGIAVVGKEILNKL